jgi:hypothetical protein
MAILDAFFGKMNVARFNNDSRLGRIEPLEIGQRASQLAAGTLGAPGWVYPDVSFLHGLLFNLDAVHFSTLF